MSSDRKAFLVINKNVMFIAYQINKKESNFNFCGCLPGMKFV